MVEMEEISSQGREVDWSSQIVPDTTISLLRFNMRSEAYTQIKVIWVAGLHAHPRVTSRSTHRVCTAVATCQANFAPYVPCSEDEIILAMVTDGKDVTFEWCTPDHPFQKIYASAPLSVISEGNIEGYNDPMTEGYGTSNSTKSRNIASRVVRLLRPITPTYPKAPQAKQLTHHWRFRGR